MRRSIRVFALVPFLPLVLTSCASAPPAAAEGHGTISDLGAATRADSPRCQHRVPKQACAKCNPSLAPRFKAARDWCAQHDVPESQCFACHPDLTFDPAPAPPAGADVVELSKGGEDIATLEPHAARGKVTIFDFYATWCAPCRKVDAHLKELLGRRTDLAVRKLNVVSWETPLADHYLKDAPNLPLVLVYGRDGRKVQTISGVDLDALDRAIEQGSRP